MASVIVLFERAVARIKSPSTEALGQVAPECNGVGCQNVRACTLDEHCEDQADGTLTENRNGIAGCRSSIRTPFKQVFTGSTQQA